MTDVLHLPPNMEALVSAFLRDQDEMTDLVDDRVYTALPAGVEFPCVRVVQIIDVPAGSPLWAVGFDIQVEGFGGSKADAWRIANTARALLSAERFIGTHDGFGVVNGVDPGSLMDLPDEDYEPNKPRWLFTSTIYGRPLATLSPS